MTIPLAPPLLAGSSCQPGRSWAEASLAEVSGGVAPGLRTFPREAPIRHCSGWGLPCRPGCPVRGGLLPHRFTLTMANHGRLFSVALSLGLPPPGVTRHRAFMESGLSSTIARRGHPAIRASALIRPRPARVKHPAPSRARSAAARPRSSPKAHRRGRTLVTCPPETSAL